MVKESRRRMPVGAEILPEEGVHFRVWAPDRDKVEVVIESEATDTRPSAGKSYNLSPEGNGYYSGMVRAAGSGTLYRFRLDGEEPLYADPASRFQPVGPMGSSEVIDPGQFEWSDDKWPGVKLEGRIIYEMHIGTFTPEGTFEAAAKELDYLADLGITLIELMPVADFSGNFGWGYDGVNLFAPTRLYGRPDDFRRFIQAAHSAGIGVILDVVYNHLGPVGNFLAEFSHYYFSDQYSTDWGDAINYDGEFSGPVREFFISNAIYWMDEYHLDGLRLDATTEIFDSSEVHILSEISQQARLAAGKRSIVLVAENEAQNVKLVRPVEEGGYGLDALWNDDFHHTAFVALTGQRQAYLVDYLGSPQELISASKSGFLYQGQWYVWQQKRRGTATRGIHPSVFVNFLENHDQIANSLHGARRHTMASPGNYRALTALMILAPGTPMLFQGQEFGSSKPFRYFADHSGDLAGQVYSGRKAFLAQFPSYGTAAAQEHIPLPSDPASFRDCILDLDERIAHEPILRLHKDLLKLRKSHPVLSVQRIGGIDGAVLSRKAFVLRFFGLNDPDVLMLINLDLEYTVQPAPEPLIAPPAGMIWDYLWSSEDVIYGGSGTPPFLEQEVWVIPARSAIILQARPSGV